MTVYNDEGHLISDVLPHVDNSYVMIPEYPKSYLILSTLNLVACNYMQDRHTFTYHFFTSGPRKVAWEELSDDLRMVFRMDIGIQLDRFLYEDERYYTLEALI